MGCSVAGRQPVAITAGELVRIQIGSVVQVVAGRFDQWPGRASGREHGKRVVMARDCLSRATALDHIALPIPVAVKPWWAATT
jgi:hypothetical protein